jgi:hypothetical protein
MLYTTDCAIWLASLPGMGAYFPTTPQLSTDQRWVGCDGGSLPITFDAFVLPQDSGQRIELRANGGGPVENERTIDVDFLSLQIFGPPEDHAAGEALRTAVDNSIMVLRPPLEIPSQTGGPSTRVIDLNYMAGPPRFVARDRPGVGARDIFAAEYVLRTARTVF